jgi:hypothetical protein
MHALFTSLYFVQHSSEEAFSNILKVHVGKFYKSPILLNKPDGTSRAKASLTKTIRVFRMFMLWAQEQGYIQELPLTKDTPMGRSPRLSSSETSSSSLLCSNDLEMTGN